MSIQYTSYLEKQNNFKKFVSEIKNSLESKEYNKNDKTITEFLISYRYLVCAKVLDQLKEFTIQPNYECLCRVLAKFAITHQQMKLLWSTILLKVNNNFDLITTSLVTKIWKELCHNKKFHHICHYEDDIMNKVDIFLKYRSRNLKKRQINHIYNNKNNYISSCVLYPQTGFNETKNYYVSPICSPQFSNQIISNQNIFNQVTSNQIISNQINSNNIINNQRNSGNIQVSLPLSPSNEISYSYEFFNSQNINNLIY
ncbi:hypothetical protein PIROE2DRAFT_8850 [Piromyces sp. E2]|nr:hypothetical protein PIROE2DRAFT_8850 [Piromyces sp. E2]|eukprot:OUM64378.1 hypothetical protein PIROE2DRAFT_8850 [Piromyces sp. E2]